MKRWAFILLIGLVACNTEKKALKKTQLYLFTHPEYSAEYCAEQFPDKADSAIVQKDTVIEILFLDSLVSDTTIINDTVHINCKPRIVTRTITIHKDSIIYRENKADVRRCELALQDCQKNNNLWLEKYSNQEKLLANWKDKAKTRWLWIALLIGGAVAYTGFKVFKTFKSPVG